MGLFDSWRRKKHRPATVAKPRDSKKPVVELESGDPDSIRTLLGEYQDLVERREALSVEREDLTRKLETGEIEATEFRRELMFRIQEAARVSETLRETTAKLTQLGYRGTLH
jgi:hypothetical protein